jgi:predicted GNAT family N-acyltransferase
MALKQIDHNSDFYKSCVALRYEVLRKPLGLNFTEEELDAESHDIHIACIDDDEVLGCCVLSKLDDQILRLRQMAVSTKSQGKGIGESIMLFAKKLALDKGYTKIMMHARDSALGFYEKMGYKIVGNMFNEVGLPHYFMEKELKDSSTYS